MNTIEEITAHLHATPAGDDDFLGSVIAKAGMEGEFRALAMDDAQKRLLALLIRITLKGPHTGVNLAHLLPENVNASPVLDFFERWGVHRQIQPGVLFQVQARLIRRSN